MLSFWAIYVLLKEQQGQDKSVTMQQIENKYGAEKRQSVEQELVSQ